MTKAELLRRLAEYPDDADVDVAALDADGIGWSKDIVDVESLGITRGPNRGVYVTIVAS